jgi:hypothetical protein
MAARMVMKTTLLVMIFSLLGSLLVSLLLMGSAAAGTETVQAQATVPAGVAEPAVSLVWLIVGGAVGAVFVGGGVAELLKKTLMARLKAKAEAAQAEEAEQSGVHPSAVSKPWWWVALLGVVATVVGAGVLAFTAPFLGYPAGLGLLIGGGGGVNATWLWNPVQKAFKGIIGALKGKFAGGGSEDG